ncbi:hypothetical protein PsorP6_003552 [Peronosclerospora sorghi]|uniref:Uncharacterized protein n=1 Tax=Peronosclerospora sorghi TaxID=230839 RepID=A0ACC0VP16_9STRA|nr:hypothetical protein PsorP6_003552 [Peronosclerospora sorghi]
MTLLVTPVTSTDEMHQALALRRKVFIDEQGIPEALEIEDPHDKDPSTIHFVGIDAETGEYVAVARCVVDECNRTAKFSRVAVEAKFRGKHFGAELMNAIENHVRDRVDMFALSSQYPRKGFYEKCGYRCTSDERYCHFEGGIEHCYMVKPATRKIDRDEVAEST